MLRNQVFLEDCDGTPPIGESWAQWRPAWGSCSFSGGALTASGGNVVGIYYANWSAGDEQYCELILGTLSFGGANNRTLAGVRMQGQDATRDGYFVELRDYAETAKTFRLVKYVDGTESELDTTTVTAVTGDSIAIEVDTSGANAVLRGYHEGVLVLEATDAASVITGGAPGAGLFDAPPGADNIDIGTLSSGGFTLTHGKRLYVMP